MNFKLIYLCLCLASCCGPIAFKKLPPTTPEHVEVLANVRLEREHEIIGELHMDPARHSAKTAKRWAAKIGADAVTMPKVQGMFLVAYAVKWK